MIAKEDIPNWLTFSRYAALPVLVAAWYAPAPWGVWLPFIIVLLDCLSDFFDGYLARKWNVQSELGRLLDPNADKLLIAVALLLLASSGLASVIAVSLILCRELFVSGLREYAAERHLVLHVTKLAKWKTTMQMIAVLTLLLSIGINASAVTIIGSGALWLATLLTVITGYDYWSKVKVHLIK